MGSDHDNDNDNDDNDGDSDADKDDDDDYDDDGTLMTSERDSNKRESDHNCRIAVNPMISCKSTRLANDKTEPLIIQSRHFFQESS